MVKEKEISGVIFSVAPFRVVDAIRLQPYLLKKFGPSIGQLLGILKEGLPESGSLGDIKLDGPALSNAIEKLMEHLGEDELISLIKRLFQNVTAHVTKEGKQLHLSFTELQFDNYMDIVFEGKPFSVYPVMLFVLEVNYPDFLGKLAQGIGPKIQKIITSELGGQNLTEEPEK